MTPLIFAVREDDERLAARLPPQHLDAPQHQVVQRRRPPRRQPIHGLRALGGIGRLARQGEDTVVEVGDGRLDCGYLGDQRPNGHAADKCVLAHHDPRINRAGYVDAEISPVPDFLRDALVGVDVVGELCSVRDGRADSRRPRCRNKCHDGPNSLGAGEHGCFRALVAGQVVKECRTGDPRAEERYSLQHLALRGDLLSILQQGCDRWDRELRDLEQVARVGKERGYGAERGGGVDDVTERVDEACGGPWARASGDFAVSAGEGWAAGLALLVGVAGQCGGCLPQGARDRGQDT